MADKVWYNCVHEWQVVCDSQFSNEYESEVFCTICGCYGSQDNDTGKVFWPAT